MKANAYLKEIYPVALFIVVLMAWAVVGASDQPYSASSHIEWTRLLNSPTVKDTCKDNSLSLASDPACEDEQNQKMISPIFDDKNNFSRLLSKLEREPKFRNQ